MVSDMRNYWSNDFLKLRFAADGLNHLLIRVLLLLFVLRCGQVEKWWVMWEDCSATGLSAWLCCKKNFRKSMLPPSAVTQTVIITQNWMFASFTTPPPTPPAVGLWSVHSWGGGRVHIDFFFFIEINPGVFVLTNHCVSIALANKRLSFITLYFSWITSKSQKCCESSNPE